jgi:hypothetical protein
MPRAIISLPDLVRDPGPAENIGEVMFILAADQTMHHIGRWGGPVPTAEGAADQGLPSFTEPDNANDAERRDTRRANGLLLNHPRAVLAAFIYVRGTVIALATRDHELGGRGFNAAARTGTMRREVDDAVKAFAPLLANVVAARDAVEAARSEARRTFPSNTESEVASVMFDAGIVARQCPLTPADLASLRQVELPPRLDDPRAVLALARVPPAATGLAAEDLALLLDAYVKRYQPSTVKACDVLGAMVADARSAAAGLVIAAARFGAKTPPEVAAMLGAAGEWVLPAIWSTGINRSEYQQIVEGALQAAVKH